MLRILFILSLLVSLLNFLPTFYWVLEVNSNFGAIYLGIHVVSLIWLWVVRKAFSLRRLLALSLILIGMSASYLKPIIQAWSVPEVPYVTGKFLKVLLVRTSEDLAQTKIIVEDIRINQPDLLLLTGLKSSDLNISELSKSYPFRKSIIEEEGHGLAIYSKYSFAADPTTSLGDFLPPAIIADIALPTGVVKVAVLSTLPPTNQQAFKTDKLIIRRLVTMMRHQKDPVIVAGNFFATPFSKFYGRIMEWTDLRSAATRYGMPGTWKLEPLGLTLPIDHIFSAYRIAPVSFQVIRDPILTVQPILATFQMSVAE